jgi:pectate lyase
MRIAVLAWCVSLLLVLQPHLSEAQACVNPVYEGFGSRTAGGLGQPVYHVTTLNDSGSGSLRDAISQGNRCIIFSVAGTIAIDRDLQIRVANVTIDGLSAPSPGITLRSSGPVGPRNGFIDISGTMAHDIIIRGLRLRLDDLDPGPDTADGISLSNGAYNIVIDHNSIYRGSDENLGVIFDVHDVTVSWNIFYLPADGHCGGGSGRNVLLRNGTQRFSVHHNAFICGVDRNPMIYNHDVLPPEISADIRNNLITITNGGTGVTVRAGKANIVNNYFYEHAPGKINDAIVICRDYQRGGGLQSPNVQTGRQYMDGCTADAGSVVYSISLAYVSGNVGNATPAASFEAWNTEASPFAAAPVQTSPALEAACAVHTGAGVFPRDQADASAMAQVSLSGCHMPPPVVSVLPPPLAFRMRR